jgi:hypothetical protein
VHSFIEINVRDLRVTPQRLQDFAIDHIKFCGSRCMRCNCLRNGESTRILTANGQIKESNDLSGIAIFSLDPQTVRMLRGCARHPLAVISAQRNRRSFSDVLKSTERIVRRADIATDLLHYPVLRTPNSQRYAIRDDALLPEEKAATNLLHGIELSGGARQRALTTAPLLYFGAAAPSCR